MASIRCAWLFHLLLLAPLLPVAQASGVPAEVDDAGVTLGQVISRALAGSPELAEQRAAVDAAAARVVTARTWPFNPELAVGAGRRRSAAGGRSTDREVSVSQEIELGGKRGRRVRAAELDLAAARARLRRAERRVAATAASAFVLAQRAGEAADLEREATDMARRLLEIEEKRLAAGDVTLIEVHLARARLGRQAVRLAEAEAVHRAALAELARSMGLDPEQAPRPAGSLALPGFEVAEPQALTAMAAERRSDLMAVRRAVEASRSRIELARRRVVPNLVGEVAWSREEGTDRVASAALGLSIPIFNRRKGEIARAHADWRREAARARALELDVGREVEAAAARLGAAVRGAQEMQRGVIASLEENLRMIERAFTAGKIGWTDVIVFTGEFLEARREMLDVLAEAWLAAIELDLATGQGTVLRPEEAD
ncbi:MAG: TolC family protein [Acidobacteriota bacterium]